jgi:hypothetical protein
MPNCVRAFTSAAEAALVVQSAVRDCTDWATAAPVRYCHISIILCIVCSYHADSEDNLQTKFCKLNKVIAEYGLTISAFKGKGTQQEAKW